VVVAQYSGRFSKGPNLPEVHKLLSNHVGDELAATAWPDELVQFSEQVVW